MIRKYKNLIPKVPASCFIFPTAEIIGSVELGRGCSGLSRYSCARRLWKNHHWQQNKFTGKRHLPCRNGLRYPCRRRCHPSGITPSSMAAPFMITSSSAWAQSFKRAQSSRKTASSAQAQSSNAVCASPRGTWRMAFPVASSAPSRRRNMMKSAFPRRNIRNIRQNTKDRSRKMTAFCKKKPSFSFSKNP